MNADPVATADSDGEVDPLSPTSIAAEIERIRRSEWRLLAYALLALLAVMAVVLLRMVI